MTGWIQEAADLDEVVRDILRFGWLRLPKKCPYCSTARSVHLYFDANPSGGLGSYWIWCSSCRRFEHGSLRPPGWWQNLAIIPRLSLASEPDAVQTFVDEVDRHWRVLQQGAEKDVVEVRRRWISAGTQLVNEPESEVGCPVCQNATLSVHAIKWGEPARVDLHMFCPHCNARNTVAVR